MEISKNLFPQLIDLLGPLRRNQIRQIRANIENANNQDIFHPHQLNQPCTEFWLTSCDLKSVNVNATGDLTTNIVNVNSAVTIKRKP